jgi:hypothetical protein
MVIFRKVERQTADGVWEEIGFDELKKGDLFKLYDDPTIEPGKPVYEDGKTVYVANGDPYPAGPPDGNYGIEADIAQV